MAQTCRTTPRNTHHTTLQRTRRISQTHQTPLRTRQLTRRRQLLHGKTLPLHRQPLPLPLTLHQHQPKNTTKHTNRLSQSHTRTIPPQPTQSQRPTHHVHQRSKVQTKLNPRSRASVTS